MPPLADVPLPAFCSWLIVELCPLCDCLFCSFATAVSENIAAVTATAMGVMFMVSFPDCLEENYPLIGASGMPGQPAAGAAISAVRARHGRAQPPAAVPSVVLPSVAVPSVVPPVAAPA